MHIPYDDLYRRIPETPKWWLDGVPRYDSFMPDAVNVYAKEVALVRAECQPVDGKTYEVAIYSPSSAFPYGLKNALDGKGTFWLGDPPNHNDPDVVPHMGMWALEILQFWSRPDVLTWTRERRFEMPLPETSVPLAGSIERAWTRDEIAWSSALKACDFAAVRDMLAAAGSARPVGVARMAIFEALRDALNLEFHRQTKDFPPDE